jgi:hypothetical protein
MRGGSVRIGNATTSQTRGARGARAARDMVLVWCATKRAMTTATRAMATRVAGKQWRQG